MSVIGFTGYKGSGKDTAAVVLEQFGFEHMKFAGPIKVMLTTLLIYQNVDEVIIDRMIEGDLKEVPSIFLGGKSPRYAMQTLGTEWGRNLMGEDFWVKIFTNAVDGPTVVSDVRFPNEVEAIQEMGGQVLRVKRAGQASNDLHPSEALIDSLQVDNVILNDAADAEEFQAQVLDMFSASPLGIQ
jgi:hypothetical protein